MLKKILLVGTSVLLAFAANTATAGISGYPVFPVSGSIKVAGSELVNPQNEGSASKIFKDTGDAKTLIALALGRDPDEKYADAKNYVLGLVDSGNCSAELVAWDKREGGSVAAEIALLSLTDCEGDTIASYPASGKNGTYKELFTLHVQFIGAGSNSCGTLDTSKISGQGFALGEYVEKITDNGEEYTSVSLNATGIVGNLETDEDEPLVITDGSFKANLAPTKALGTTSNTSLVLLCD